MDLLRRQFEDPDQPLIGPNIWMLKKAGMILPENKLSKILRIIIHEMFVYFIVTQYIELYLIGSDTDMVLNNLKISMISVVCATKVNTFLLWQKEWRELLDYVTSADKFERINPGPVRNTIIINSYTRYCQRLTTIYWVLAYVTFVAIVTATPMRYISSSTFRDNIRNGTEIFPHIFISWMPFDKYHYIGSWITVLWHVFTCFYAAVIISAYDTTILVTMIFFGGKIDLLRERCKHMFDVQSERNQRDHREVIRQIHEIHISYLKYTRLFNSLLSPVMLVYIVVCSLVICASIYQMTSASNTAQMVVSAEFLIFRVGQIFVFCWHSNYVFCKSEELSLGLYNSKWWAVNSRQRRDVQILLGQLCIKNIYTIGPFAELTLAIFINILKGAYSFYTLLKG